MVVISLKEFPYDLHRGVKARAPLKGITVKALIIRLMEEYLEKLGGDSNGEMLRL